MVNTEDRAYGLETLPVTRKDSELVLTVRAG